MAGAWSLVGMAGFRSKEVEEKGGGTPYKQVPKLYKVTASKGRCIQCASGSGLEGKSNICDVMVGVCYQPHI